MASREGRPRLLFILTVFAANDESWVVGLVRREQSRGFRNIFTTHVGICSISMSLAREFVTYDLVHHGHSFSWWRGSDIKSNIMKPWIGGGRASDHSTDDVVSAATAARGISPPSRSFQILDFSSSNSRSGRYARCATRSSMPGSPIVRSSPSVPAYPVSSAS